MRRGRFVGLFVPFVLWGCGESAAPVSDGAVVDASVADGASTSADASAVDAAADADMADAALPDAGAPPRALWAVSFGGVGLENALAVAVDSSGDVYVGGFADEPFVAGDVLVGHSGSTDGFVMKLAAADGTVRWARAIGSAGQDWVRALALSPEGELWVLGDFQQTIDLGTGPLVAAGNGFVHDVFLARLDPDDGSARAAVRLGGPQYEGAGDLVVGADGQVLLSGNFDRVVDFGTGPIGEDRDQNLLLASLAPDGTCTWAVAPEAPFGGAAMGLGLAANGDAVFAALSSSGGRAVVGRHATAGGGEVWSLTIDQAAADVDLWAVAVDAQDHVYAAGSFTGTLEFASEVHGPTFGSAPVILVFDGSGAARRAFLVPDQAGGTFHAIAAVDGDVIVTGHGGGAGAPLVRFAVDGTSRWSRRLEGGFGSVAVGLDGAIALAGGVSSRFAIDDLDEITSAGSTDVLVVRLVP